MDVILLVITVVSLTVAFVMSVAVAKLTRAEKDRAAARVAALSAAADEPSVDLPLESPRTPTRAPWSPAPLAPQAPEAPEAPQALQLATGFLGASEIARDSGGRQKSLAFAAVVLFLVMSGGLVWLTSEPRGTTAAANTSNVPLELVSLTHQREDNKLAVSGLVRNPLAGQPVEDLSAVVFLFDQAGTFVASSKANVDFLKLGAGDETPFVVSINDAPATVARYRVSFRTEEGVVPHVDRREALAGEKREVRSEK